LHNLPTGSRDADGLPVAITELDVEITIVTGDAEMDFALDVRGSRSHLEVLDRLVHTSPAERRLKRHGRYRVLVHQPVNFSLDVFAIGEPELL
jgi:hypothetical protein